MIKKLISIIVFLFLVFTIPSRAQHITIQPYDSVNFPSFGKVYIFHRTITPHNVIVMISGNSGWRTGIISYSHSFSEMNSLVIGVDITEYYSRLKLRNEECYNVAADFVNLITDVEKKFDFPDYQPPVIMGLSSGATLTYAILSQSRTGTFIGGISLGFCPDVELPKKFCEINGLSVKDVVPGKKYLLQPNSKLENRWIVLNGKIEKECNYANISDFVSATGNAELVSLQKSSHGLSKWSDYIPEWKESYHKLIEQYEKEKPPLTNISEVKNLPLVITNSKVYDKDAPIALLISGDGGWYGFEQSIADNLSVLGVPTIGMDSKKYFWKRRTPEETASDISKALNYYGKEWGRNKFILIGYSLGAELVPFITTRLSDDIRTRVQSMVLMSPAETTDFEIHITNMLGMGNRKNTYITVDEIIKLKDIRTLIIFGDGEKTRFPELLDKTPVMIKKIPGDHHYKYNLPLIVNTMKENKVF